MNGRDFLPLAIQLASGTTEAARQKWRLEPHQPGHVALVGPVHGHRFGCRNCFFPRQLGAGPQAPGHRAACLPPCGKDRTPAIPDSCVR
jgi:hypothetical protein